MTEKIKIGDCFYNKETNSMFFVISFNGAYINFMKYSFLYNNFKDFRFNTAAYTEDKLLEFYQLIKL